MEEFRIEQDSIGEREVPLNAYYGVQSLRAYENFKISGRRVNLQMVKAIVEIKKASAIANRDAGVLSERVANAVVCACDEIISGKFLDDFIVDAIQGGAGTSLNMNANEVVANRAIEILGGKKGEYTIVHPNDHVNCGQSTNDVYPSAGKIALIRMFDDCISALRSFKSAVDKKAVEYADVIKMGRTQLQDAVPISFGQVFHAYSSAIERDIARFYQAISALSVLNMGGTAIGTALNADEGYVKKVVPILAEVTGLKLSQAEDLIDGTQNLDCFVYASGIVKACATTLSKMANDLRLMSSGPRVGLGEISLPAKQNGSSIMPGKVNPVIPEVVNQIAFNVIGNDVTVAHAVEAGQFELNAFEPIIFYNLFESLETLKNGIDTFRTECVDGLQVNAEVCREEIERSVGIVTALCPRIGYAKSAKLAKRALRENKNIRDILLSEGIMSKEDISDVLDPKKMI